MIGPGARKQFGSRRQGKLWITWQMVQCFISVYISLWRKRKRVEGKNRFELISYLGAICTNLSTIWKKMNKKNTFQWDEFMILLVWLILPDLYINEKHWRWYFPIRVVELGRASHGLRKTNRREKQNIRIHHVHNEKTREDKKQIVMLLPLCVPVHVYTYICIAFQFSYSTMH